MYMCICIYKYIYKRRNLCGYIYILYLVSEIAEPIALKIGLHVQNS